MSGQFDIFENLPSGFSFWRAFADGREEAIAKIQELTRFSGNEFVAIESESNETVARVPAAALVRLPHDSAGLQ